MQLQFEASLHTDGSGLWSDKKQEVLVKFDLFDVVEFHDRDPEEIKECGSLLDVKFDPDYWCTNDLGLIYTDELFLKELKNVLKKAGYNHWDDIGYSEAGMQGDDFVNFDVGDDLALEILDYVNAVDPQ